MSVSNPARSPNRLAAALTSDLALLLYLALGRIFLHALTNGQYGFHRDELAMLDDARRLAWGYVAYPPLTPFVTRLAFELFGTSLVGLRLPSVLAQAAAMVLAGLMARELGGKRPAQLLASVATAVAPLSLVQATMFQYVSFDYLWWVLTAYLVIRLLKSDDPRWWLGIGATVGLGLMTKYTMAYLVAGLIVGVLVTRARRYLLTPWPWAAAGIALLIMLPNLAWQAKHDFISLDFLTSIHARDVAIGRTAGYLTDQLFVPALPVTVPLWIAGLYFYLLAPAGRHYRVLGWMWVIPFGLFLVTQGRGYYLAPAYPMLLAAGSVLWERWVTSLSAGWARIVRWGTWTAVIALGVAMGALLLPMAPINSGWWQVSIGMNENLAEEIGWPELVRTVAGIYNALPETERAHAGILAANYGEAGAIDLYGPAYGLPPAISAVNSYWLHGYPEPPPDTLVLVGVPTDLAQQIFRDCQAAGRVSNRYGVANEESTAYPVIYVCGGPRIPWPEFWAQYRYFG
jgi:4-amino-4-deoxy-L-arabinose transferase-like glycosyltransferase